MVPVDFTYNYLHKLVEDPPENSYINYITMERAKKIQSYLTRKKDVLSVFTSYNISSSSMNKLEKWYDTFYEYSTMGYLDNIQFWKAMKKLDYPFAKNNTTTLLHSRLYSLFCTDNKHIQIVNFLLGLLVLSNGYESILKRDTFLENIFQGITVEYMEHICNQLSPTVLYHIEVNNELYFITRVKLLELYKLITVGSTPVSSHPFSFILFTLFYF